MDVGKFPHINMGLIAPTSYNKNEVMHVMCKHSEEIMALFRKMLTAIVFGFYFRLG